LAHYFERLAGPTVDHFVPKARRVELAYEWSNYRLACAKMNARKGEFEGVLDPCELEDTPFELSLLSGALRPAAGLRAAPRRAAEMTAERLGLDDPECREIRRKLFEQYASGQIDEDVLKHYSPFVWSEARRRHLL
jgi:hypothetical protein